jgi:cytochrome P450
MMGFANLTFAGGRDTVINSITNSLRFLAEHRAELARLRDERTRPPRLR